MTNYSKRPGDIGRETLTVFFWGHGKSLTLFFLGTWWDIINLDLSGDTG
jgi:hypothetical protein